ncbi:MAG: hypothetical protein QOE68_4336 [Thermoanaerobaculia bacterium]|jgi:hypothetical protein|nr:hypothetical protein [Thermoanaerobaculia bacterium]
MQTDTLQRRIAAPYGPVAAISTTTLAFLAITFVVALSVIAGIAEGTAGVFVFCAAWVVIGLVLCIAATSDRRDRAVMYSLFGAGLFIRSIFAYAAHYAVTVLHKPFFASDSQTYYTISFAPLTRDLLSGFNDVGFLVYNHFATWLSMELGNPSALANMQVAVVSGAAIAPIAFALSTALGFRPVAKTVSVLLLLDPVLIAYSSCLLRDAVISMLGFYAILLAVRSHAAPLRRRIFPLAAAFAFLVAIAVLRRASAVFFAGAIVAFLAMASLPKGVRARIRAQRRNIMIAIVVTAATLYGATHSTFLRQVGSAAFQINMEQRLEESEQSSISAAAARRGLGPMLVSGVFLNFTTPFPFQRVFEEMGTTVLHWLLAIGALVRHLELMWFFIGFWFVLRNSDRNGIVCGVVPVLFAIASTLTFGDQVRYMSEHATPLMAILIAYGFQRSKPYRTVWMLIDFIGIGALYAAYAVVKRYVFGG